MWPNAVQIYPGAMQALRLLFVVTAVPFMRIVEGAQVCGLRTAQGRTFVRNGQDTTNTTEIPWNVIVYDMKVKTGPTQICGGSLIKTDYFISGSAVGPGDSGGEVVVPNLDAKCLRCICEAASGCNTTYGCALGFCGPFYMSRVYWRDAYEDCGRNYTCSAVTVTNYMSKYGQDCNGDGHTNCDDYAMIHFNGGNACYQPMGDTNFSARYELCRADTLSLPPRTYHSLINSSTGMASADTSASVLQCGCSASYVFAAVIVSMWGAARRPHYMHRASILAATSF
ncbi:hypothetical protein FOCC_FOCC006563 [Frankliniella occidentalis]|nr:hypothetical protein FOCC_FOCC006563 [Frankliniella occidentalis]